VNITSCLPVTSIFKSGVTQTTERVRIVAGLSLTDLSAEQLRQTYGYLRSRRAPPLLDWYQIILLGDRGTYVLVT